jgi:hypothetical protein
MRVSGRLEEKFPRFADDDDQGAAVSTGQETVVAI